MNLFDIEIYLFYSHETKETQWKHPVTGKEKYIRGGELHPLKHED